MAVRHQFVIREASIVNRPNNLTLSIPTFIVTSHCSAPLAPQPSPLCTPHRSLLASGMMDTLPALYYTRRPQIAETVLLCCMPQSLQYFL